MTLFVLLGKPGCHLCDEMKAAVAPVLAERGDALEWRDVRQDAETRRAYELEIPVLLVGQQEVARHRITAAQLRERLAALGL